MPSGAALNERRIRILTLRSAGLEMDQIAGELGISVQKAYREMEITRALLGALNDCNAVKNAIEEGYVKISVKIHP